MHNNDIIKKMESMANARNAEGMARFGIRPKTRVLGISIPVLRKMAKEIKKTHLFNTHGLAMGLWDSGIHEARILAGYIAEPEKFNEKLFNKWVKTFDSWDIVDQVCSACLRKTKFVERKIFELANRRAEFEKRTAFTLICCLAVHNKKIPDKEFLKFFPLIEKTATDERNFVKKSVNWALRQIGKRNKNLNKKAINLASKLHLGKTKSQKWIANNAISELKSSSIQKRFL